MEYSTHLRGASTLPLGSLYTQDNNLHVTSGYLHVLSLALD